MNKTGTGLGLTISKNLAKALGGDIKVRSKRGTGTEFYLFFKNFCLNSNVNLMNEVPSP